MKNQLPVMPLFRSKTSGNVFSTLQEAAKDVGYLTINNNYELFHRQLPESTKQKYNKLALEFRRTKEMRRDSLFNEVEVISNTIPEKFLSLFDKKILNKSIDFDKLAAELVNKMIDFIEKSWDSSKTHIMAHSSGYDSRLISAILKKLLDINGSSWLGDLYFIVWEPEIPNFDKIIEHIGWGEQHIIRLGGKALNFHAESLAFDNIGRYCSDINRFICYCFDYLIYREIKKLGVNNVEIISGLFSDEILRKTAPTSGHFMWDDLSHFLVHFLHDIHFEWSMYDTLLPFMSFDVFDTVMDFDLPKADDMKLKMLMYLDAKLARLPNYRFRYFEIIRKTGTHPYYKLSDETINKMESTFRNSWYFNAANSKKYLPMPKRLINDAPVFKEYTKAAICDYLINEGCKINYDR